MPPNAGPVLGILGGMGPAATADFMAKLAAATPASTDQEHIATLVYSDPTTPDRSTALMYEGESPLPHFLHGIKYLTEVGCTHIAIPCNTAHYWYEEMQAATPVPIIHMVDAVAAHVEREAPSIKTIGLLSTEGTAHSGIYHRLQTPDRTIIDLRDLGEHNPIQRGIEAVKSGESAAAQELLTQAARLLETRGAQGLVYGCTDISAALGAEPERINVPVWDSAVSLAIACVEEMRKNKNTHTTTKE